MSPKRCLMAGPSCWPDHWALPGKARCAAHTRSGWSRRPPGNDYAYASGWQQIRRQVLERDGYACQLRFAGICVGRASQVDHIVQPEAGGGNDLANLRSVCRPCHARRTGRQGALAKQRRAAQRKPRPTTKGDSDEAARP